MIDYLAFWVAKSAAEFLIVAGLLVVVMVLAIIAQIPIWIAQSSCEHSEVSETQACEAICRNCGKYLGFIGTWRQRSEGRAQWAKLISTSNARRFSLPW